MKTSLPGDFAFDALSACNVYDKEIEFYGIIAPQIIAKYRQLNEPNQLLPETYGVCNTNKAMLFEDLSLKGYGLSTVRRGFNMVETKFILRKAAALHAINAVLQQNQPDIFKNFKHGMNSISCVFHYVSTKSVVICLNQSKLNKMTFYILQV